MHLKYFIYISFQVNLPYYFLNTFLCTSHAVHNLVRLLENVAEHSVCDKHSKQCTLRRERKRKWERPAMSRRTTDSGGMNNGRATREDNALHRLFTITFISFIFHFFSSYFICFFFLSVSLTCPPPSLSLSLLSSCILPNRITFC